MQDIFDELEFALRDRNPELAELLAPGLQADQIEVSLRTVGIRAGFEPIIRLFGWRNGLKPVSFQDAGDTAIFPELAFHFLNLDVMIAHFRGLREGFILHPNSEAAEGRYFPLFYDWSTCYLALDLSSHSHRIILFDPESEDLVCEAYSAFDGFIADAVRANQENDLLMCFKTHRIKP